MLTFLVSGVWHGASINFALWGLLNGAFLVAEKYLKLSDNSRARGLKKVCCWVYTYCVINLLWILFRSESISDAWWIMKTICTRLIPDIMSGNWLPGFICKTTPLWNMGLSLIGICMLIYSESVERRTGELYLVHVRKYKLVVRLIVYLLILALPLCFGIYGDTNSFIYARF